MERQTEERTLLLGLRTTSNLLVFCRRVMYEGDRRFILFSVPPYPDHYISNVLPELMHYPELIHPWGMFSFSQKGLTALEWRLDKLNYQRKYASEWIMWWTLKQNVHILPCIQCGVLIAQTTWKLTHMTENRWSLEQNFLTCPIHGPLAALTYAVYLFAFSVF